MIFSELRDRDSAAVNAALARHCLICKAPIGEPCVTLTERTPIHDKWGSWVHIMRADGMPYTKPKKKTA